VQGGRIKDFRVAARSRNFFARFHCLHSPVISTTTAAMKSYLALLAMLCGLAGMAASAEIVVPKQPRRLALEGHCTWPININTATATLNVPKVVYRRPGTSGTIKLTLWAGTHPYGTKGSRGWAIAESKLGQLKENQSYSNLSRNCKLTRPPAGRYYITLLLAEYLENGYVVQHYATGNQTMRFE
jgi:hypothetical protein